MHYASLLRINLRVISARTSGKCRHLEMAAFSGIGKTSEGQNVVTVKFGKTRESHGTAVIGPGQDRDGSGGDCRRLDHNIRRHLPKGIFSELSDFIFV